MSAKIEALAGTGQRNKMALIKEFSDMQDYVNASVLENFRSTVIAMGQDPNLILNRANVSPEALDIPGAYISHKSYRHLLYYAAEATNCPHFPIEMTRHSGLSSMGVAGLLMLQASDVGKAWEIFSRLFTAQDTFAVLELHRDASLGSISYTFPFYDGLGCQQAIDMATNITPNIMRQLCGPTWRPLAMALPYSEPPDLKIYDHLNIEKLIFDHHTHELFFDKSWLDHKIENNRPEISDILDTYFSSIIEGKYRSTTDKVVHIIRDMLASGECSIEQTAVLLSVSVRTLQTRLKAEQCGFQQLLDKVRKDIAIHQLCREDMSLTGLAMILGYSEQSAFTRAFKRWFGVPPKKWTKDMLI